MLILIGAVPERLVHGHQSRLLFPTSLAPPGPAIGFSTATLIQGTGCVNGWPDFSLQNTFVDNCYRFCCTVLIYWIRRFSYYFIFYGSLETNFSSVICSFILCFLGQVEHEIILLLSKLKPTLSVLGIFSQTRSCRLISINLLY